MKKRIAFVLALAFYASILPVQADLIKGNFSDIVTKGPWVDVPMRREPFRDKEGVMDLLDVIVLMLLGFVTAVLIAATVERG